MTEDLTTYTLVGSLGVTASKVSGNFYGDADRYLYKDFGADHFDKIDLKFAGSISDSDPYGYLGRMYMGFTNVVGDASDWGKNRDIRVSFARYSGYGEGNYYITLENGYGGGVFSYRISTDTVYYLTLTRTFGSDSAALKIYSDAARTTLLTTLTITDLSTTKWRYFYAASGYYVNDGTVFASGYYENYVFGGSPAGQHRFIGMAM